MELFATSHKDIFRNIHNYLAGRFVGATRERALLDEVIKGLFCHLYILRHKEQNIENPNDPISIAKKYREVFGVLKTTISDIFEDKEEILLDPQSIQFLHSELGKIDFLKNDRDPFGDLYEVFIGTGVREEEGQFFTPKNGIDLLVSLVDPKPHEKMIDPACGAGGFLTSIILHLNGNVLAYEKLQGNLFGVDKDQYLAKLASTHVALLTMSTGYISCGDSLAWINKEGEQLALEKENYYDVVVTNPPFGKKIVSSSKDVQKTYELGYKWKLEKSSGQYIKTDALQSSVPPQVLFVEKCIRLLKPGGRLGIVLPESLITSTSYGYVVQYMQEHCSMKAVMGMPEDFFKTSGKGGTHTKACLVIMHKKEKVELDKPNTVFFAEAKWCGHDSRGRSIEHDDLPLIVENYQLHSQNKLKKESLLGYALKEKDVVDNILSPRYYNPEIKGALNSLKETHEIMTLGDLVKKGVVRVTTGDEVGKLAYGTGSIPFVRTSDISTWEVKLNPKHGVSEEIYQSIKAKQDVQVNDILMVKDGTYLIGTCAIITEFDTKIIYQSHLFKIRVVKPETLSPFLLLAVLSSKPIKDQIKSKRFTQDIIDSLGKRIYELELPIPKDQKKKQAITDTVKRVIEDRIEARELARKACLEVVQP